MARVLISFFLLSFGSCVAFAQGRIIDETKYKNEMRAAGEFRLKEKYRVTQITRSNSGPVTSEIIEYEPPAKRRVTVTRIDRGESEISSEWIFIDQMIYVKRKGLSWQAEKPSSAVHQSNQLSAEEVTAEYKDLGIEPNGSMRVLQKTTHKTIDGSTRENTLTVTSWIDRSGRLRKEEYVSTSFKTATTTITMDYEIDPTIKIEAPIN
jgi:hypothetical protein